MTALIELKDVAKGFKSADGSLRSVLDDVDFRLAKGEIVALLGQSGSGKSTLLRIMAGLIPADAGDVRYRGQPLFGPAQGIAMVFQSFALFPWLTVQQNVELGLEAAGVAEAERAERAEKAIELIGLAGFEGALPRELSGGMRQRVGLARALVAPAGLWLVDEPLSALDPVRAQRAVSALVSEAAARGVTLVATLHQVDAALAHFPRIVGLRDGRLAFDLPSADVTPELLARLYAQHEDELHGGAAPPHETPAAPAPVAMQCR